MPSSTLAASARPASSSTRPGPKRKICTPPKRDFADCCSTLMIVSPSRTHAPRLPAKLNSLYLLNTFTCRPYFSSGGATNSPTPAISTARIRPATASQTQNRAVVMPEARITTSSLPRARLPSPSSEPIRAATGSSWQAKLGRLKNT